MANAPVNSSFGEEKKRNTLSWGHKQMITFIAPWLSLLTLEVVKWTLQYVKWSSIYFKKKIHQPHRIYWF